jgi:hypothetical protein
VPDLIFFHKSLFSALRFPQPAESVLLITKIYMAFTTLCARNDFSCINISKACQNPPPVQGEK